MGVQGVVGLRADKICTIPTYLIPYFNIVIIKNMKHKVKLLILWAL